jgi:BlaI family penicillinase repressor
MKRPKISEAEWEVMEVIWRRSPITASEVVEELTGSTSWAPTTIRTMLARLAEKKILALKKLEQGVSFLPLISREECVRVESHSFLERVFGGAAKPLLVQMVQDADLSGEDIAELRKLLAKKEKNDR